MNGQACYDEISALQQARKLDILVPTVRRLVVLNAEDEDCIIIMDRVQGRTLEQL